MTATPDHPALREAVAAQPHPLVFVTISGAHLYGFASPDSDFDLRGTHILPAAEALGLKPLRDTLQISRDPQAPGDIELDLVTHDIRKFMGLMLKNNGYVLEQLHSPLVLHTTPAHEELKSIGHRCVTRHHVHHYLGFAANQWRLFAKETPPRVKPLLYIYRVLLTGIHLMRTGEVQANLPALNAEFRLPYIGELIERKLRGPEQGTLDGADTAFHRREFERLEAQLKAAAESSPLPDHHEARDALSDLLVRLRLGSQARS